jgi:hypothetical protein
VLGFVEAGRRYRTGIAENMRLDRDTPLPSNAAVVAHGAGHPIATAPQSRARLGPPATI